MIHIECNLGGTFNESISAHDGYMILRNANRCIEIVSQISDQGVPRRFFTLSGNPPKHSRVTGLRTITADILNPGLVMPLWKTST